MKIKKILAGVLSAAMLFSCMSFSAFAEETDENVSITSQSGEVAYYETLKSALAAATDGDTVKMLVDETDFNGYAELRCESEGNLEVTLDMNGKKFSADGFNYHNKTKDKNYYTGAIVVSGATATLNITGDGEIEKIYSDGGKDWPSCVLYVTNGATVNIKDGYFHCERPGTGAPTVGTMMSLDGINNTLNIYGGRFYNPYSPRMTVDGDNGANNKTVFYGGEFYGFDLTAKPDDDWMIPDALTMIKDGDWYKVVVAVAQIDSVKYGTLQDAVNSIGEDPGDYTIKLLTDVSEDITVTQYADQKITITCDGEDKPVISGSVTVNGRSGLYESASLTLKNIVFDADAVAESNGNAVILVPDGGARYAKNITVDACDFVGTTDAAHENVAAIRESTGGGSSFTVENSTATGIHSLLQLKNVQGVTVENVQISDCNNGINLNSSSNVTVANSSINVEGYGIRSGVNNNGNPEIEITLSENNITAGENAVVLREGTENAALTIESGTYTGGTGYDAVSALSEENVSIEGGIYSTDVSVYLADGFAIERSAASYSVVPAADAVTADTISVEYKDVTAADAEKSKTYEIVLKANDNEVINELASVDLTFDFTSTPVTAGNISFTVLPADGFTMTHYENSDRYMFNYNGLTAYEGTAKEIVIGTITVDGYGSYTIATADATTNIVNTTTVTDNLVDNYVAGGAEDDDAKTGGLVINEDTVDDDGLVGKIEDGEIAIPTRKLTINIDFPNEVMENAAAYQDMTVTIVGGTTDELIELGSDKNAMEYGSYVIEKDLAYNTTYTVTVEGAGYRTARYSVVLTEDKVLNFWNNVMDNATEVEEGKATSAVTTNFLAGDIVKDNNINIYDLSAAVSYFGAEELSAENNPEYAKYDLNRDGIIDSKDVAYVLVSWGE